jgi:hypothetical protein
VNVIKGIKTFSLFYWTSLVFCFGTCRLASSLFHEVRRDLWCSLASYFLISPIMPGQNEFLLPTSIPKKKKKNLHASHFYFVNFFIDADFFFFFWCVSYSYQAKRSKQFIYSASRSLPYVFVVIVFLVIRHILYASNFNSKIHNKVVFFMFTNLILFG